MQSLFTSLSWLLSPQQQKLRSERFSMYNFKNEMRLNEIWSFLQNFHALTLLTSHLGKIKVWRISNKAWANIKCKSTDSRLVAGAIWTLAQMHGHERGPQIFVGNMKSTRGPAPLEMNSNRTRGRETIVVKTADLDERSCVYPRVIIQYAGHAIDQRIPPTPSTAILPTARDSTNG